MIRELRQEIIASVMLIGDYDELMKIYADVLWYAVGPPSVHG